MFQRELPNKRRERRLGCLRTTSEWDTELLLQARIWYLRKEWVKRRSFYLRSKHSEQRKCSGGFQGKDLSCTQDKVRWPFSSRRGKRGFLTPQKGLLCSVGRSLAPGPSLKDQLCWTIDFTAIVWEPRFPPFRTYSRTSSPAAVGHSLTISFLSAVPLLVVLSLHLCCWATPCAVPAQLRHGRDQGAGLPKVFLGVFQPAQIPKYLGWQNAGATQEHVKPQKLHLSWGTVTCYDIPI